MNLTLYFLVQKTIVSVKLPCSKCRQKVMKLIAKIEGITSIVIDPSKNTVTVIGEADPVKVIKKVREFRKCASIVSIGPLKEEKKEEKRRKMSLLLPQRHVKGVMSGMSLEKIITVTAPSCNKKPMFRYYLYLIFLVFQTICQ
ncbi:Heavy metal-associated domain [Melia azedarach]|uniref:Heavy metal-associated domain n=1 Tax=Melia azedarach TaxID=155640 RepID=A0ACC1WS00_MELAZ|nr:Heavy metal-associated domain [Melia azedarach]